MRREKVDLSICVCIVVYHIIWIVCSVCGTDSCLLFVRLCEVGVLDMLGVTYEGRRDESEGCILYFICSLL